MDPETLSRPWLTLGIRLTVFLAAEWEPPPDVWQTATAELPENDDYQPRARQRMQTGPWRGGALMFNSNPTVVVWSAAPPPSPDGGPDIGEWRVGDIVEGFRAVTKPWLINANCSIKRIGFGLNSVLAADDRTTAYRLLDELIPSVRIDAATGSDFFYQINHPIPSVVAGGLMLNRFMKWSAPLFRTVQLQLNPQGFTQTAPLETGRVFAGFENDVNTPVDRVDPLDNGTIGAIYDELIELACQNLEFGELGKQR